MIAGKLEWEEELLWGRGKKEGTVNRREISG